MKALTIRQPWAWSIAAGHKPIENRGWVTPHRGQLAVHSAKQFDDHPEDALRMVRDILRASGTPYPKTFHDALPLAGGGLVLATVDLVDVCTASYDTETVACGCGPWAMPGQAHWRLADARPLGEPVPATGRLGLWDWAPAPTPSGGTAPKETT